VFFSTPPSGLILFFVNPACASNNVEFHIFITQFPHFRQAFLSKCNESMSFYGID
jgi:hypothetical protein